MMSIRTPRSGSYIDLSRVSSLPEEVISGVIADLPNILAQMPWNEKLELLASFHSKTVSKGDNDKIATAIAGAINGPTNDVLLNTVNELVDKVERLMTKAKLK
jgi:hypothetical protein